MFRLVSALVLVLVISPVAPGRADPTVLKPGDEVKADIAKDSKMPVIGTYSAEQANGVVRDLNLGAVRLLAGEQKIGLKAGQDLAVTVNMVGKQQVGVILLDPTGKPFGGTDLRQGTAKITFKKVNAAGEYRLLIVSDRIGEYELRTAGPSVEELGLKELEEKRERLKKELAEVEEAILKLKKKKP